MKILYDEITASLNDSKGVIYVTVPYFDGNYIKDGLIESDDILEAELIYSYSESFDGVYADTEYASGQQLYELDGVSFVGASGHVPTVINELANAGEFDEYAAKAWGG